jgi:hypothetical protein
MTPARTRQVLRADALFDLLAAVLFLSGTWDGLYDALDLPQRGPAIFVQIGGAAVLAFAYLLWVAANDRALTRPVALAAAVGNGLAALIIAVWYVFADPDTAGALGDVILIVTAVVLAFFAVTEAMIVRERPAAPAQRIAS